MAVTIAFLPASVHMSLHNIFQYLGLEFLTDHLDPLAKKYLWTQGVKSVLNYSNMAELSWLAVLNFNIE